MGGEDYRIPRYPKVNVVTKPVSNIAANVLNAVSERRKSATKANTSAPKGDGKSMFGSPNLVEDSKPTEKNEKTMDGGTLATVTVRPKSKKNVIDIEKIVAERTPSLADNTPTPGETNNVLDNKIEYAIASNQPQEEESQQSLAHRIFNGIRKAVKGNDVAPTAEEELTAQTAQAEPAESNDGDANSDRVNFRNGIENTYFGGKHRLADNDANADYSNMDEGLKDLFSRFNGGTGATKEQIEQVFRYMNSEQSLNKG